jgi:hypothetical protein
MKKTILFFTFILLSIACHAQFEEGKCYFNASMSSLNVDYNKTDKWNVGICGKIGYIFMDDLMLMANVEYGYSHDASTIAFGPSVRYYIVQNGLYMGAGANFVHHPESFNDLMPCLQVGYAFFLNGTLTIEPEIYYNQSFKHHDYSGIGLRIGLGFYF